VVVEWITKGRSLTFNPGRLVLPAWINQAVCGFYRGELCQLALISFTVFCRLVRSHPDPAGSLVLPAWINHAVCAFYQLIGWVEDGTFPPETPPNIFVADLTAFQNQ
jgi:hypothetical protein